MDPGSIATRRHAVLCVLRAVAVLHALVGLAITCVILIGRTERYIGFDFWQYQMPIVFTAAFFLAPAGALALFSRAIARWIVPGMPREPECPNCGYSLKNLKGTVCPECGADVGGRSADGRSGTLPL